MITKIKAKDFKGLTFEQPLSRLNLVTGPNGSGKSARTQALQLVLNGYISGLPKQNGAIHAACSAGAYKIFAECQIGKTSFLKRYKKDESGSVALDYQVNYKKASVAVFSVELGRAGNPKLIDLSVFMALSDRKKIDEIFSLFPPAGDVAALESEISAAREKLNTQVQDARSKEQTAVSLMQARTKIDLGPGTMAEVIDEGKKCAVELDKAKADLAAEKARIEAEEAILKAEQKATEEQAQAYAKHAQEMAELNRRVEEEKAIAAQKYRDLANESKKAQERANATLEAERAAKAVVAERERAVNAAEERLKQNAAKIGAPWEDRAAKLNLPLTGPDPIESIQSILSVLQRAGCETCAAVMACKREIRKFKEVA